MSPSKNPSSSVRAAAAVDSDLMFRLGDELRGTPLRQVEALCGYQLGDDGLSRHLKQPLVLCKSSFSASDVEVRAWSSIKPMWARLRALFAVSTLDLFSFSIPYSLN